MVTEGMTTDRLTTQELTQRRLAMLKILTMRCKRCGGTVLKNYDVYACLMCSREV